MVSAIVVIAACMLTALLSFIFGGLVYLTGIVIFGIFTSDKLIDLWIRYGWKLLLTFTAISFFYTLYEFLIVLL